MGNNWYKGNFKQRNYINAQLKKNLFMECLYSYNNKLEERSGIYIFTRQNKETKDGTVSKYAYIGQSVNVLDRIAGHFIGFEQRIDISLKSRGLWYQYDPYAWKIDVYYCDESELDEKEREFITRATEKGYTLYNITSGGQNEGKEDINERASGKGYRDGLEQGYKNAIKEVKEFFDKYLSYYPKDNDKKKDGSIKEIYIRKLKEFKELLENEKGNM